MFFLKRAVVDHRGQRKCITSSMATAAEALDKPESNTGTKAKRPSLSVYGLQMVMSLGWS